MEPSNDVSLFYLVKKIFIIDNNKTFSVTKVFDDCYFDNHTQSFKVFDSSSNIRKFWSYMDFNEYVIIYFNILKKKMCITKIWM